MSIRSRALFRVTHCVSEQLFNKLKIGGRDEEDSDVPSGYQGDILSQELQDMETGNTLEGLDLSP